MSALTSLLARDRVVPVRKIEEALQRQVVSGGEIETVLLEMSAVAEDVLAAYRASTFNLLPATREEVMSISDEIMRLVPREAAVRYRFVPLSLHGRELTVALSAPLSTELSHELGFFLGYSLSMKIVNEVRLAAGLAFHYGVEMSPRLGRLAKKLSGEPAGVAPVLSSLPSVDTPRNSPSGTLPPPAPEPKVEARPRKSSATMLSIRTDASTHSASVPSPSRRPTLEMSGPTSQLLREREMASSRSLSALRGPLISKVAVDLLRQAQSRDEVTAIFFAFARQFFDYTALMVVQGRTAHVIETYGIGTQTERAREIAVPLDVPSTLRETVRNLEPSVGYFRRGATDAHLLQSLDRVHGQPSLVVPIVIRKRAVMIIYGDRSGETFALRDVPELQGFVPRVAEAFERVILRKKIQEHESSRERSSEVTRSSSKPAPEKPRVAPAEPRSVRRRAGTPRPGPLSVLGLPRSAPPPPLVPRTVISDSRQDIPVASVPKDPEKGPGSRS